MKSIVRLMLLCLVLVVSDRMGQAQVMTEVILESGGTPQLRAQIQARTTDIMRTLNIAATSEDPVRFPASVTAGEGRMGAEQLAELALVTQMRSELLQVYTDLIELRDKSFEIRRLYMMVTDSIFMKEQELVLSFNQRGELSGARFAMELHNYERILTRGRELQDDFYRRQIIHYLELFRTAYNRKDVDFIEQQFSEDALIITGTRVQKAENADVPRMRSQEIPEEQFTLIKQTKTEYIDRLRNHIFRSNAFINLEFKDITIVQHPVYEKVYGINLLQNWTSSNYSDQGYLFLMIDYSDETKPLIYVRAWQPEPFEGGRLIDFSMFDLVK